MATRHYSNMPCPKCADTLGPDDDPTEAVIGSVEVCHAATYYGPEEWSDPKPIECPVCGYVPTEKEMGEMEFSYSEDGDEYPDPPEYPDLMDAYDPYDREYDL